MVIGCEGVFTVSLGAGLVKDRGKVMLKRDQLTSIPTTRILQSNCR